MERKYKIEREDEVGHEGNIEVGNCGRVMTCLGLFYSLTKIRHEKPRQPCMVF